LSFASSGNDTQDKLDELLQSMNISAEAMIETGTPGNAIIRAAERTGAALLVIGRRSRAGKPDGMDVGELIKRSPCPVVFSPRQPSATVCFWTEWQQEEHAGETRSSPNLVPELSL
jgi:nucleotide-binding universal stress UspA family protein